MPDSSLWAVPITVIANHRAAYYANRFDDSIDQSLIEDTLPLFEREPAAIKEWAEQHMVWTDVSREARIIEPARIDFQAGWSSGEKSLIDIRVNALG